MLRNLAKRALNVVKVVANSGSAQLVPLAAMPGLAWDVARAQFGPHLAVRYYATVQPSREALVDCVSADGQGTRRWSWQELDRAINRVCNGLQQRGIARGSRVALMLPNCAEIIIAQLALSRLGASAVQVSTRLTASELGYIVGNAEPVAIVAWHEYQTVVTAACAAQQTAPGARPTQRPWLIWVDALAQPPARGTAGATPAPQPGARELWWAELDAASAEFPPAGAAAAADDATTDGDDDGAVIVYTSGTTGKPKGAARRYRDTGMASIADMIVQCGMHNQDRHLVTCPLYHSAAPAFVALTLALGGTVVVQRHFEPTETLRLMIAQNITSTLVVPTMLVRICALPAAVHAAYPVTTLRWVLSGAAPLATETARQTQALWGPVLWNFYGATETGLVTMAGPDDHVTRPGTIGKALVGNELLLLDESGRPVPVGSIGELYVRNTTLMTGYHRNAAATQGAMRNGYISVGDLARVDAQGYYYLESRKHDMVISGGVNIYPREIEDVLAMHPAILEAAVVGLPDAEWGERLCAFVVLRPGHAPVLTEPDVIAHCKLTLADYKRPKEVRFLPELPRNPTGKVIKRELKAKG